MELMSPMKMARFQTFWIQMRNNKPLDESRKTSQTSVTTMTFTIIPSVPLKVSYFEFSKSLFINFDLK
ncbi:hypothetical protein Hanom_Chr03g00252121 [Helianthus anomalus]